jgi:uncharacterized beta-barrel protein YwiB (DUF1934 family)
LSETNFCGGEAYEMKMDYQPIFYNGFTKLTFPTLDLTGVDSIMVSFKHYVDIYTTYPSTIGIATSSSNGMRWDICYEESDLTGLAGVTTTFRIERGQVTLRRTGKLRSEMVFREGVPHESLYQMEFGALLITVCAKQIEVNLCDQGGNVDLVYSVEIEHGEAGLVEYHLDIRSK